MIQKEKFNENDYIALTTARLPAMETILASTPRAPSQVLGPLPADPSRETAYAWRLNAEARLQLYNQDKNDFFSNPRADQIETWVLTAPRHRTGRAQASIDQAVVVHRGPDDPFAGERYRALWPAAYRSSELMHHGFLEPGADAARLLPVGVDDLIDDLLQGFGRHGEHPQSVMKRMGLDYAHLDALGGTTYKPIKTMAEGHLLSARHGRGCF